ncbi:hypothetical protein [Aquibacillus sediminis]|uniref:hypothetical protein n=1 Tax=Aquibacillus sediminis TaxID=2574734 RepID=UPI0011084A54|nr:hypothetical protein [Aquibacillus sediminis]
MDFKFIEPKNKRITKVNWKISERTRSIVKHYAEFTEHTEDEIVDEFLTNILLDKQFLEWIKNKRYNKRILNQLFSDQEMEELDIG